MLSINALINESFTHLRQFCSYLGTLPIFNFPVQACINGKNDSGGLVSLPKNPLRLKRHLFEESRENEPAALLMCQRFNCKNA